MDRSYAIYKRFTKHYLIYRNQKLGEEIRTSEVRHREMYWNFLILGSTYINELLINTVFIYS
jgi:hypothetical protein